MEKNVGELDKGIRLIVSLLLVISGYVFRMPLLYAIAAVPFLTAVLSFCPLYTLIGVKTCPAEKAALKQKKVSKKK